MAKKPETFTLATSVWNYFDTQSIDVARVRQAVISAQGACQLDKHTVAYGGTSVGKKEAKVKFSESKTYIGKTNVVLEFASWNDAQLKLEDKFGMVKLVGIPSMFTEWLNKFKPAEQPSQSDIDAEIERLTGVEAQA